MCVCKENDGIDTNMATLGFGVTAFRAGPAGGHWLMDRREGRAQVPVSIVCVCLAQVLGS